jgi:hypothetical protein
MEKTRKTTLVLAFSSLAVGLLGGSLFVHGNRASSIQEAKATSGTITLTLDFSGIGWDVSAKYPAYRAYDGTAASWLAGKDASSGDAETDYSYLNEAVGSDNSITLSLTSTGTVTRFGMWISGTPTAEYDTGLEVGHSYTIAVEAWASAGAVIGSNTYGGYPLSVTDTTSLTTYSVTLNMMVPYLLDSTYYSYSYWYSVAGVSKGSHTWTSYVADTTTKTGYNDRYTATLSGIPSGSAFLYSISLIEKDASSGSGDSWSQIWNISTAVTISSDTTISDPYHWNITQYEKSLADVWAASFLSSTSSGCASLAVTSSTWSTTSTSYSAMSSDSTILAAAQADFKSVTASASSTAVLAQAAARYDFIYGKYGTSLSLSDYASRSSSSGAIKLPENKDGDSDALLLGIASIALLFSGAYFFVRKKKGA